MKLGENFKVSNDVMMQPHIGRLVEVTPIGETELVKARIMQVYEDYTVLKVVPDTTKE